MYRQAARQSLIIVCSAVFLGFSYTYLTGKGFFGKAKEAPVTGVVGPPPSSIDFSEAKMLFEKNNAVFVDARHYFDFRRGHIKAALNLPLADFENRAQTIDALPKDKVIVVYCDAAECNSSIELAAKLYEHGLGGVRIFFGGWQDWTANKLPTETSQ